MTAHEVTLFIMSGVGVAFILLVLCLPPMHLRDARRAAAVALDRRSPRAAGRRSGDASPASATEQRGPEPATA